MMINAIPKNIDELKKKSNNKHNWHDRLESVETLKNYDCIQSRDILTRLALHDPVFKVKEKAFRAAQALGVSKNGKPIYLSKRKKGSLVKGINKKLEKVRNSLPELYSFDDFKNKFKETYPEDYDIYDGNMDNKFDKWLSNVLNSLPKK
ncbi:hypothetical protein [Leuconostoc suionicum]|uniref:hypothetical protein n=1 Tax=Leuconostoc suionicum TaxID=1511761 RepID=UPI0024AD2511|nr:hypothetical protein [Leuconostoc suionicum]MDI6682101.1 hypothetical protein [Leuconostoc suionicum]